MPYHNFILSVRELQRFLKSKIGSEMFGGEEADKGKKVSE
jgi:hypothetical protein